MVTVNGNVAERCGCKALLSLLARLAISKGRGKQALERGR